MKRKHAVTVLDSWVWLAYEAAAAQTWADQKRDEWARASDDMRKAGHATARISVRLFRRTVRAGGASKAVIVGVVQRIVPVNAGGANG